MTFAVGQVLLGVGLFMAVVMAILWWVQVRSRNAGWVDVAWAGGLGVSAVALAFFGEGDSLRRSLVGILGGIWGLRLCAYLFRRVAGEAEDGRYRRLREHWGEQASLHFLWFFEGQALLVVLFSLPFAAAAYTEAPLAPIWAVLAVLTWLGSVGGEALADAQLARFRNRPENRGKTCRDGLWRYSRHPNYFFEWLHWWSYVFLAMGAGGVWVALLGPVLMILFLYKVTGIPYTELQALASRGDDYRDYQQTTSAFFPWFPRKGTS